MENKLTFTIVYAAYNSVKVGSQLILVNGLMHFCASCIAEKFAAVASRITLHFAMLLLHWKTVVACIINFTQSQTYKVFITITNVRAKVSQLGRSKH